MTPPPKTGKRGDSLKGTSRSNLKNGSSRCVDEAE